MNSVLLNLSCVSKPQVSNSSLYLKYIPQKQASSLPLNFHLQSLPKGSANLCIKSVCLKVSASRFCL